MYRSTSPPKRPATHSRTTSSTTLIGSSHPATPSRNLVLTESYFYTSAHLQDDGIHASPTKALAISRLNHEINQLTSWLEGLFAHSPIPARFSDWQEEVVAAAANGKGDGGLIANADQISATLGSEERYARAKSGNDVLQALKALKQANLSADHLRLLVHDAEVEELGWLGERQDQARKQREEALPARTMVDKVFASLSAKGKDALQSVSFSAVELGMDLNLMESDSGDEDLARTFMGKIVAQAQKNMKLEQQIRDISIMNDTVSARMLPEPEIAMSNHRLHDEKSDEIRTQTAQFSRDTKQINLKIMEYEDRAKALERQLANLRFRSSGVQDVLQARRRVEERKKRVGELQQRIAIFTGLRPDLEASENGVRRAMNELKMLKRRREEVFEKLGHG